MAPKGKAQSGPSNKVKEDKVMKLQRFIGRY